MKKIEAIIRPYRLDAVRDALDRAGIEGMTVTEVYGFGREKGQSGHFRGVPYEIEFLPKLKLEISLVDALVSPAIEAIRRAARTGHIGDGKIIVLPIAEVVHVRTGEREITALPRAA